MRPIASLLRFFLRKLYHSLSGCYDLVAWAVSLGAWRAWGLGALSFVEGERVLELGPGPGHLQAALFDRGWSPIGLDESRQMLQRASHRIRARGCPAALARGLAQELPFASGSFDTILSTFPAEYILDGRTPAEAHRVLKSGGRMVIVPWAMRGETRWLFEITDQGPTVASQRLPLALEQAGFETETRLEHGSNGVIAIILARKPTRL